MESERHPSTSNAAHRSRFPEEAAADNAGNGADGASPAEGLKDAAARLAELKEYATYFVGAKVDGLKLTLRNIALYAVLGIVGGIVGIGLLITAAALLLTGLAGAIGAIFNPDRPWVGGIVVGLLVLVGTFGGVIYLMKSLTGSSRKRTIEKYENRKRDERHLYGHDVAERAREQVQQQGRP